MHKVMMSSLDTWHGPWLEQPWMQAKLAFVVLLNAYHIKTHLIFKALQRDLIQYGSNFMRIWNEGATLLLFAIVFLVILKSTLNMVCLLYTSPSPRDRG